MRLMHVSYAQALATPAKVVIRQIEFNNLEQQIKNKKQRQANA